MGIGVLFDCDGVLINTEEVGYNLLVKMLSNLGVSYTREEYTELVSGVEQKDMMQTIADDYKAQTGKDLPDTFMGELHDSLIDVYLNEAKVIEGVRELLQNLRDNNIPFAVCSNSPATELILKLRAHGLLDDFMPNIYSKDHVENPKPHPQMYLEGAKLIGVDIKQCFVIEDSQTGTKAGVAAGATVIGFVGEQHRGDHEAEYLADAGAKLIAFSPDEIWSHIKDRLDAQLTAKPKGPTPPHQSFH